MRATENRVSIFPRNQGGGVLAPSSTGLAGQVSLTFPGRRRAPPRRDGSRDLDEKSSDLAKDVARSSFRAHPKSRRRAREARNHADSYRNNWIILGGAARRKPPCASAPRQIARFDFGVLDTQHLVDKIATTATTSNFQRMWDSI